MLVIDNGPRRAEAPYRNLADAMERLRCEAGTNGGFFDIATFQPNGLMIGQGRSVGQFDRKNWAEGVLAVRDGTPILVDRDRFELDPALTELLQSGPWLVRRGISQSGYQNDEMRRRRTFIATDGRGTWLLGYVSGSTLRELAVALRSTAISSVMPVEDALNLDGGPSSGLWIRRGAEPSRYIEEETIVRNFIGIRTRQGRQ